MTITAFSFLLIITLAIFLFCYFVATRVWIKVDEQNRKLIYCNERIDKNQSIIDKLSPYKNSINKWAVLIGPEGGFSNHENKLLSENNDILSVSLGDKVLRSDTAITVSLFIIQQLLV